MRQMLRPRTVAERNARLVARLREDGSIRSSSVEAAFLAVPRHLFLPHVRLALVYRDHAIALKSQDGVQVSSSSQPAIMAEMLERLQLRPGLRVLEIGAGSGYNAALISYLVGPAGFVATIEIDPGLADTARIHLAAAGQAGVRVICADGVEGDAEDAPFDALIATAGVATIPEAWIAQVRVGGRLIVPLVRRFPKVVTFERTPEGLRAESSIDGIFVMLRSPASGGRS